MAKVKFETDAHCMNTDYEPGEIGYLSLHRWKGALQCLIDPDTVVYRGKNVAIRYDYPLDSAVVLDFKHPTGYWTRHDLAKAVVDGYRAVYAVDARRPLPPEIKRLSNESKTLLNRLKGELGIWGHVMADLSVDSASVGQKGIFSLGVSS